MATGLQAVAHEYHHLVLEAKRRVWRKDIVTWARERLGINLWSGQREVCASVLNNRRTLVHTCHGIGKSFSAALIIAWWIDVHEPGEAYVITSAPTGNQVKAILWRVLGRLHAQGGLPGRVNQTEWLLTMPAGNEELVAQGRKPDEYNPTAFQGIHALRVLFVFDEACGIPTSLWDAADSMISNNYSKALAIGNPDFVQSEFYENAKPGSSWNTVSIGAFDTPNFTGEQGITQRVKDELIGHLYVEERRKKWAPRWYWVDAEGQRCAVEQGVRCVCPKEDKPTDTHPLWQSKVLGIFPENAGADGLIPLSWIKAAQQRSLIAHGPSELGLDVGGGGDATVCGHRHGPVFRVLYEDHEPDTMKTCGKLVQHLDDRKIGATLAKVDVIGIGRGVVNRAQELDKERIENQQPRLIVYPVNVGTKAPEFADDEEKEQDFANMLTALWWNVRGLFESGGIDIDPDDEELAAELLMLTYGANSKGQTVVKYKDGPSPNRADALMLAFAPSRFFEPEEPTDLVW